MFGLRSEILSFLRGRPNLTGNVLDFTAKEIWWPEKPDEDRYSLHNMIYATLQHLIAAFFYRTQMQLQRREGGGILMPVPPLRNRAIPIPPFFCSPFLPPTLWRQEDDAKIGNFSAWAISFWAERRPRPASKQSNTKKCVVVK